MSEQHPLVSIILVTYNQARWLGAAIDSVVSQSYPHWELMLVDNGSTDDTTALLERYRADPRIKVQHYQYNQKHTVVSNRAIADSTGQFIAFLCGDDYFLPTKLEKQVVRFGKLPSDYGAVYCNTYRLDERTQATHPGQMRRCRGRILKELLFYQPFEPIAPMVRRECCVRYPYNENVFMEGEGLFSRIAITYAFDYVDEFLCVMRDHETNMGKEIEPSLLRNVLLCDALFSDPDFPSELRHLHPMTLAWIHRVKGWQSIRTTRNYEQGRNWLVKAVRYQPTSLANLRVVLGLSLSVLPRSASNGLLDVANRVFGAPPQPPKEFHGI